MGVFQPNLFLKRNADDYLLPERFYVNQIGRQQYDEISAPPDSQPSKKLDVRFQHSVAPGGLLAGQVIQLSIQRPQNDLNSPLQKIPKAT